MAQKQDNRRLLIGVGIFALLIGINVFVRLGRSPRPPVQQPPVQGMAAPDPVNQPQPTAAPSAPAMVQNTANAPSPAPIGPSTASPSDMTAFFSAPLPSTTPLEAIQALRDRLLQLPPVLQGPPAWGRTTIPEPSPTGRNPFRWVLPEPLPDAVATVTLIATAPVETAKPEEKVIVFSGSMVMAGKSYALLRRGKEMHLLEENAPVPQTTLVLSSISSDSASLKDISGETLVAQGEDKATTGFLKALSALQRGDGFKPLPIHESTGGTGTSDPVCYLAGGRVYHALETCAQISGPLIKITAPDQLPLEREPCKACWTKDPL